NLESQLKQQNASDKLDLVLQEIPRVREDLGNIPLVTPTSQIVGTQAVMNVLMGERYKTIAKETAGILKGEYGRTPAPVNKALQDRVLEGAAPMTDRPANHIPPEVEKLIAEVTAQAKEKGITLSENTIDDVLIVALFQQIGWKYLENRNNPSAFEPVPSADDMKPAAAAPKAQPQTGAAVYTVELEGKAFVVKVSEGGDITNIAPTAAAAPTPQAVNSTQKSANAEPVNAPMAGNILKVEVKEGQQVAGGDVLLILEAMKMETQICAAKSGTVQGINVKQGDVVAVNQTLMSIA
ncbi:MAG: biotin/lipoyl-containing protein, partial [Mannheimia varigena]|nr:biotin/lipoyl-containing protein [Mannheimia varigena]